MNNLHEAIRAVYPDAKIAINGFSIDEIVAVDQVTGEPFEFDNDLVLAKSQELYDQYQRQTVENNRLKAYAAEADPLFFKAQRGEATTDEWTAKVAEIKARFPYPGGEE